MYYSPSSVLVEIISGQKLSRVLDDELKIIDVSNKASPVLVGSLDMDGSVQKVYCNNDYVYLSDHYLGFKIIDVNNKESPSFYGDSRGCQRCLLSRQLRVPCRFWWIPNHQYSTARMRRTCLCPGGWIDSNCSTCSLNCKNGGIINSDCTSCICYEDWAGYDCSSCAFNCENEGSPFLNCTGCFCVGGWHGLDCTQCDLDCNDHQAIDETCTECIDSAQISKVIVSVLVLCLVLIVVI